MNLLTKKLKDKLKLIDDIDKEYIINAKNKNSHASNNIGRNSNLSSIEFLKNTANENFDKIYSDFLLNDSSYYSFFGGKSKKNNSISNNNFDKDPTNENSIDKEKNNDSSIHKDSKKAFSGEKYIFQNEEKEYPNQNNDDNADVGQRLINYGKYLKNKIENQRLIQDSKIRNMMIPKINARSKSDTITPEKISERLFQNYKKNVIKNKVKNENNSKSNISNNTNFSYHPKLNKNSLLIAQKLEPSFIRLNKKKKIKDNKKIDPKKNYSNLYGISLFNNNASKSNYNGINFFYNNKKNSIGKKDKNKKEIIEKMNNLYLRGVEQRNKKEKIFNDNQKKKEGEYKNYSFKPTINKNIHILNFGQSKKKNNSKKEIHNIYKKQFEWKKKIENKINKKKEKKDETMNKLCTFKPEICVYNSKNNDVVIPRVLAQMNEYVNKRRKNIKYKISEEIYKNKKLGGDLSDYTIKSTIPQEFELETEMRNRDTSKNKNRSCNNFHIKNNNYLMDQNSDKKSLNNENGKNYWFFKEEMNSCCSNNNTRGSNKVNETQSQIDFIEAVNLLHDKLDKLNI